jgi:hypothetical protein
MVNIPIAAGTFLWDPILGDYSSIIELNSEAKDGRPSHLASGSFQSCKLQEEEPIL